VDLKGHLRRVQERALKLPDSLRALAGDYVGFFQGLAQQHTLLERHCFVVLPDHSAQFRPYLWGAGYEVFWDGAPT